MDKSPLTHKMNSLLSNWQYICLAYVMSALVAGPIFMKEAALAMPFYSAQVFIVFFSTVLVLMGFGVDRILDEMENPQKSEEARR
jgi:membrane protein implicated in regulation of membrane protease activity